MVKDQGQWVEGFVRRLYRCLGKSATQQQVLIVDDSSSDDTMEVLQHLQRYYPFELRTSARPGPRPRRLDLFFDARGMEGKELLEASLFDQLSRRGAGKWKLLSK